MSEEFSHYLKQNKLKPVNEDFSYYIKAHKIKITPFPQTVMACIKPEVLSEFLNYFIPYPSQVCMNSAILNKLAPFLMTCIVAYHLKALLENSLTNHLSSWPEDHNTLHYFQLPFEIQIQRQIQIQYKYSRHLVDPQNIPVTLQLISFFLMEKTSKQVERRLNFLFHTEHLPPSLLLVLHCVGLKLDKGESRC